MILHQKLSTVIASQVFKVTDAAVLSAIGCHTTLKAGASDLDKVLFVADKLQWDGVGEAPYSSQLRAGLARSLDEAAFAYLDYLWQGRQLLRSVHPWMVAAHHQLANELRLSK